MDEDGENKTNSLDSKYSYLDEEDVYEEYLEPTDQIEVDEDEEVEIIEILPPPPPPHPMAFKFSPPPPPPPYFRNRPSPFFEREVEIEIDEGEVYEYEPENVSFEEESSKKSRKIEPSHGVSNYVKFNEMAQGDVDNLGDNEKSDAGKTTSSFSKNLVHLTEQGESQAERIKRGDGYSKIVSAFKILLGIACVMGMFALCFAFVFWNHSKISVQKEYSSVSGSSASARWNLPSSPSNDIIRKFYDSLGELSVLFEYRDMLIKGKFSFNGKTEDFYCIRRANGNSYVKIGSLNDERAYYISGDSDGVFKLLDMRANGRRENVSLDEALVLRALSNFDENIFKITFGSDIRVIGASSENFVALGKSNFNGELVDVLEGRANGLGYKYRFSSRTGLLSQTTITMGNSSVDIDYFDYENTNVDIKFPITRKLTLNGKPFGEIVANVVLVNKGFIIP